MLYDMTGSEPSRNPADGKGPDLFGQPGRRHGAEAALLTPADS